MYDISAIKDYILFLKNRHNLSITLHPIIYDTLFSQTELITFNIHDNSYCVHLKTYPLIQKHCIEKQSKVLDRCSCGRYTGTCHAGVKEFVYPINDGDKNIGFISVSGYKTENAESYMRSVCDKYGISYREIKNFYNSLKSDIPSESEIQTLITPLCNMLELMYLKNKTEPHSEVIFPEDVVRYIKRFHNQNISSKDICKHFSCSRSYLSAQFNQYTNKSIREYINELRIDDAKTLLKYSDLSVTEIAFSVGFTDSNYFSSIFKKHIGISPIKYRKQSTL